MKKVIFLVLIALVSLWVGTVDAEPYLVKISEFPAKRIVTVPNGPEDYDHRIYSFRDGNNKSSLLFVCHGAIDAKGTYYACMGGKYYSNYAAAIDNELRYHINRGEINRNGFERVYFLSCYSGYAPRQTVTMPVLNKKLQMVLYEKTPEWICEYFDDSWRVYHVALLIDRPPVPGMNAPSDEFRPPKNSRLISADGRIVKYF